MATDRAPRRVGANWPLTAGLIALVAVAGTIAYLRWPEHAGSAAAINAPLPAPSSPSVSAPQAAASGAVEPRAEARPPQLQSGGQSEPQGQQAQSDAPAGPEAQAGAKADQAAKTPSFDVVRVSPEGNAVIAGRAEPGSQVIVHDGERELGAARADRKGEFVLLPDAKLPPGGQQLTLSSREPGGAEHRGDQSVVVVVPEPAGAGRTTTSATGSASAEADQTTPPSAGSAGSAVAVLLPENAGSPRVLQAPPGPDKTQQLALNTVDYDQTGEIRFSGSAKPSASVRAYVDNQPAGAANADAEGRWAMTPPDSVPPGVHQLRLDQLGPNGQVQSRIELPFQRTAAAPEGLAPGSTVVQPGNSLWRIAQARYGSGYRYTVIYLANREQIRDPDLIYPGQVFALPPTAP